MYSRNPNIDEKSRWQKISNCKECCVRRPMSWIWTSSPNHEDTKLKLEFPSKIENKTDIGVSTDLT